MRFSFFQVEEVNYIYRKFQGNGGTHFINLTWMGWPGSHFAAMK